MRIAKVVLQNVKSYAAGTTIELAPGINAICGENGAGKSTLLEAIGFVLFGYRPYKLDAFVREGTKSGSITVSVEDDGGVLYHVVRKLGSGATQAVYDELNQKIAEGDGDVRNWLLGFFGLEPTADLAKLFEDTVGPPQGTLTAIFLENAAPRAKKFDRLLQIDDYAAAAQGLRPVSNHFRDQAVDAERRAASMEGDARRLPEVEGRQLVLMERRAALATELAILGQRYTGLKDSESKQEGARQAVHTAEAGLEISEGRAREAQRRREERAAELQAAVEAARLVEASRPGYESYRRAVAQLTSLEEQRKERDRLRRGAEEAAKTAIKWEQGVESLRERLAALDKEAARATDLESLVPEEERREQVVREAEDRVRAREQANRQIPEVRQRLEATRTRLKEASTRLAEVGRARSVAARLQQLREQERGLQEQLAQLDKQLWSIKQAGESLAELDGRIAQLDREAETVNTEVARLAPLEAAALQAEARQQQRDAVHSEVGAVLVRHEEAQRSRRQTEGGLCPFLREPCRNMRPGVSLDAYFDGLIAETASALGVARDRLAGVETGLAEARSAEKAVSRLPDLRRRASQLAESLGTLAEERQRLSIVAAGLDVVIQQQAHAKEEVAALLPEIGKAEAADKVAGAEELWRKQQEEATRADEVEAAALATLQATVEREAGAAEALAAAKAALAEMRDPRAEAVAIRRRISREQPEAERALERGQRESANARAAEESARKALEPFARLEEEIALAIRQRDEGEADNLTYMRNLGEAERLPRRREADEKAAAEAGAASRALAAAEAALEAARLAYDQAEHLRLRQEMEEVAGKMSSGRTELELCQQEEGRLVQERDRLLRGKAEMERAQKEAAEARGYVEVVEAIRRALDDAGPEIARALLRRISARATNLYRELLGEPAVSLEWGVDYEIRCRLRSEDREFKQLSGGEQMSAALAVRLALLQTLSNLRIAFLDEPTAHMDALRRSNLATQIQNLRSFDQLVVISHDDSFDTLFGHVVRLIKRDGATMVED